MSEPAKAEEQLTGDDLTIAFLKANLAELRTGGIVTVAMTNPNVMSYMQHWEGRTEKAEAEVARLLGDIEVLRNLYQAIKECRTLADFITVQKTVAIIEELK